MALITFLPLLLLCLAIPVLLMTRSSKEFFAARRRER